MYVCMYVCMNVCMYGIIIVLSRVPSAEASTIREAVPSAVGQVAIKQNNKDRVGRVLGEGWLVYGSPHVAIWDDPIRQIRLKFKYKQFPYINFLISNFPIEPYIGIGRRIEGLARLVACVSGHWYRIGKTWTESTSTTWTAESCPHSCSNRHTYIHTYIDCLKKKKKTILSRWYTNSFTNTLTNT